MCDTMELPSIFKLFMKKEKSLFPFGKAFVITTNRLKSCFAAFQDYTLDSSLTVREIF